MPIDFATSLTVKHNFHFGPTLGAIVVFLRLALWGSFTTTTAITSNDKILNYSHGHQLECSSGWHQSSSSSSRELVGYTRRLHVTKWHYTCTSGNTPPGKYVLKHTVNGLHTHILLGYTSREMRVIDTITGNSQTHIHRLTYIF
ncbi:hypothetical protein DPMN_040982 [Dreissena polymorpha]|uniref:Uncharacterized protein n=1 Tax=Dreissena polymorpha TaxID=45954 RepID=A0A9D4HVT6_DREPO|nr:hypothetical protein DPMN_040982 [Dreissena polymorpha]